MKIVTHSLTELSTFWNKKSPTNVEHVRYTINRNCSCWGCLTFTVNGIPAVLVFTTDEETGAVTVLAQVEIEGFEGPDVIVFTPNGQNQYFSEISWVWMTKLNRCSNPPDI